MNINVIQGNIAEREDAAIVVNLFEGVTQPGGATGAVDAALGGAITDLISEGDITGKRERRHSHLLIGKAFREARCRSRIW